MKLVVGLGNPGRKYEGTRHNVGFRLLAELAQKYMASPAKAAFQGETAEVSLAGVKTLLLWPQTFMNLSGGSVLAARDFYKLNNEDLLVVCDDFNLPLGRLRIRAKGSAGGQKGLANTIQRLGTDAFARLRVGVGPVPTGWEAVDFVLGKFTKAEQPEIDVTLAEAADAVVDWATLGVAAAMNRHNPSSDSSKSDNPKSDDEKTGGS